MTVHTGDRPPNFDKRYPAEPLTPAEVNAILSQCSRRAPTGIRNRALLTLLYRSGLRISELRNLRPVDVDLDRRTMRLVAGGDASKTAGTRLTKTGQAQTRGYHPSADDALARWLDVRRSLGIRGGMLFCTLDGGKVSDRYVRDMLKRYARRAGIEKRVHPHGLRHTFACELEAEGVSVTTISKLLGHHSIATTSRYLDHLTNGQAVNVLQGVSLPEMMA